MKQYKLEIFIDEKNVRIEGVHEKSEGLTLEDIRLLVSVFEEYKIRLLTALMAHQEVHSAPAPEKVN